MQSLSPIRARGSWPLAPGPWLNATRPATLPAAIVPVLVGTAAVHHSTQIKFAPFLAAMVASVLIQIGTNLSNDAFDFWSKADTAERLGPRRLIQEGLATPREVFLAACACFAAAALIGLYLVSVAGLPILIIGVFAILSGLAYTGGPWPLGYHGLGDLFVFVFFGVLGVVGSAYLQIHLLSPVAVLASIPVGLLVTNILVVNNLRDIETDRLAGKRTLSARIGPSATRFQYALSLVIAFLMPIAMRVSDNLGNWFWLPWLSLPLAAHALRLVTRFSDGPTLNLALKRTGQLHLLFGVLFAASLWL
jgi:1,4-dihydroxy-2-naphthoate polyprenyltransferase